jgi:hypothetical protein
MPPHSLGHCQQRPGATTSHSTDGPYNQDEDWRNRDLCNLSQLVEPATTNTVECLTRRAQNKQSLKRREVTIPEIDTTTSHSQFQLQSYPDGTQHHSFHCGGEVSLDGGIIDPMNHPTGNVHPYSTPSLQGGPIATFTNDVAYPSSDLSEVAIKCGWWLFTRPDVHPQEYNRAALHHGEPIAMFNDGADPSAPYYLIEDPFQYGCWLPLTVVDSGHPCFAYSNSSEFVTPFQHGQWLDVNGHPLFNIVGNY